MWPGDEGNWGQSWPPQQQHAPGPGYPIQHCPPTALEQQVDWAALAQQWIHRQNQPAGPIHNIQSAVEEPPIMNPPVITNEIALPPVQNVAHSDQAYWKNDPQAQEWNPVATHQPWIGPGARDKETFDYGHVGSHNELPPVEPANTYDYNHQTTDNASFDEKGDDQYWNNEESATNGSNQFERPPEQWGDPAAEAHKLEMLKRKKLPSWIREGLEKMEKEKQRKIEQEKVVSDKGTSNVDEDNEIWPKPSKFDSGSEEEIEPVRAPPKSALAYSRRQERLPPSPPKIPVKEPTPPPMTPAEREKALMMKVRKMLTEILLEVTDTAMRRIAKEVLSKARSRSLAAKQFASSSALASIAGNLGLGGYDSDSNEESDSNEPRHKDNDSDSDPETVHQKIKLKRMVFEKRQAERMFDDDNDDGAAAGSHGNSKHRSHESKSVDAKDNIDDGARIEDSGSTDGQPEKNRYYFENKTSMIPGLDTNQEDNIKSSEKSSSSKKHKLSSTNSKRSRSRSHSRSRSKRSKDSRHSKRSRSRSRSRRRDKYRSRRSSRRSKSYSSDSSSTSKSHRRRKRSYSRSRSRDRSKYKKSKRSSRSRSGSPRKSSKHKSSKTKSGKKSS